MSKVRRPARKSYFLVYLGIGVFFLFIIVMAFYNMFMGKSFVGEENTKGLVFSGKPTYSQQMVLLLANRCIFCHGPGGVRGNTPLNTYQGVMRVVTPGDVNSPLVTKTQPGGSMSRYLTKAEANLIKIWVAQGAKE